MKKQGIQRMNLLIVKYIIIVKHFDFNMTPSSDQR